MSVLSPSAGARPRTSDAAVRPRTIREASPARAAALSPRSSSDKRRRGPPSDDPQVARVTSRVSRRSARPRASRALTAPQKQSGERVPARRGRAALNLRPRDALYGGTRARRHTSQLLRRPWSTVSSAFHALARRRQPRRRRAPPAPLRNKRAHRCDPRARPRRAARNASHAARMSASKAKDLMVKGEKCLTRFSFFGGGSAKYEDAAECFADAGKQFMMAKAFEDSAKAYERAAEMHEKCKSEFDAGTSRTRAAEAYQKAGQPKECAAAYQAAVDVFVSAGKGNMAANAAKKLGETMEAEGKDATLPEAIDAYKQAVNFFESEGQPRRADGCREKVAMLSAKLEAYDDAMKAFDEMGRSCLESNLGKFNAKKWFTYSVLCCLAREDVVKAKNLVAEYASLDYTFVGTREHQLCESLCAACEADDDAGVADAAAEYDKIKRLDPWTTKVLLAIKATISPPLDPAPEPTPPAPTAVAPPEAEPATDEEGEDELPDFT
mmetsp:Transcript_27661/g.85490  ORF Transcript_27661/g.85490 Transcript_27661/m.85490 type:complete len:496 (-) Transcript_27661:30-1517(-)